MKNKRDILIEKIEKFADSWKKKGISNKSLSDDKAKIMKARYSRDADEIKQFANSLKSNSIAASQNRYDSLTSIIKDSFPKSLKNEIENYVR